MSHEILFLDSNSILFFNSQVKSALLCCSLMCTWIGCSHSVKGVIKLSCLHAVFGADVVLECGRVPCLKSYGISHISELMLDHAALWLPKC
jgi:hypothetical protein